MKKKKCNKVFYNPIFHLYAKIIFWLTLILVFIYDTIIFRIKITGRKNLEKTEKNGAFLISNHTLYLDPGIIAHCIAPRRTYFTALKETFRIPIIGTYIRYLGAFPVSEDMPVSILLHSIKKIFKENMYVHFFPEGELNHIGECVNKFKNGVFHLAVLLNKPVIPITIIKSPRKVFSKTLNRHFCRVIVKIGKPIYPAMFKADSLPKIKQVKSFAKYARKVICGHKKGL